MQPLTFMLLLVLIIGATPICGSVHPQSKNVAVSFKVDEEEKKLPYRIWLKTDEVEIEPDYVEGGFIKPQVSKTTKTGVKITLGEETVEFGEVDNELFDTEWVIGVDNKPFEASNVNHLPGPMRDSGKIIYFIDFMSDGFIKYKISVRK